MEKKITINNRYQVIRKIGEGGMAKVYLAYDVVQEQNIALKVLKKENVNDKKVRDFKREAKALSLMDDDNIVKVYDVGEEGNLHYIAQEYVDGMTIKDYILTCSPIPVDEVIDMTIQVLNGLMHAHDKNVIHKDIKSQNILLNEDKHAKITDFGIASIMDDEYTKTQSLMGTPQYVAPEILNRDTLTKQSDIYSVGILMFEMLIGKAPFTGDKPGIIMMKQMNHPLPSVINERPDVSQSLENVIIKATAKNIENRYKSAAEMLVDLDTIYDPKRKFEEKLILKNDVVTTDDKMEKTVLLNKDIDFVNINKETQQEKTNSKRNVIIVSTVILLGLMIVSLVLLFAKAPMEMPDIVGKTEEEGIALIEMAGFNKEDYKLAYESSDDVEATHIISTMPEAGTIIDDNSIAFITVSTGLEKNVFADYEQQLISSVQGTLEAEGHTVTVTEEDSSYPAGTILSQEPAAGTSIAANEDVSFVVSSGNYTIEVPNFTGLTKDYVEQWATENTISVSSTYACNDKFDEGQVYSQNPLPTELIYNGGSVSIDVSDGACDVIVDEEVEETDDNVLEDNVTEESTSEESTVEE